MTEIHRKSIISMTKVHFKEGNHRTNASFSFPSSNQASFSHQQFQPLHGILGILLASAIISFSFSRSFNNNFAITFIHASRSNISGSRHFISVAEGRKLFDEFFFQFSSSSALSSQRFRQFLQALEESFSSFSSIGTFELLQSFVVKMEFVTISDLMVTMLHSQGKQYIECSIS